MGDLAGLPQHTFSREGHMILVRWLLVNRSIAHMYIQV